MNAKWESDDFENHLIAGIIGLYETRPEKFKFNNYLHKVTESELNKIKGYGLYYAPEDRLTWEDLVDITPPAYAFRTHTGNEVINDDIMNGYITHSYVEKIKRLPNDYYTPMGIGSAYAIYRMNCFQQEGLLIGKEYGFIKTTGDSIQLRRRDINTHPFREQIKEDAVTNSKILATTLNIYDDRKHLWNVQATERNAKVLFGIYPEHIKSLFYARTVPVTDSGRKRPILHWVSAHKKRLRDGIDVDIDKYLRGTSCFEMNGTMFEIKLPIKKVEK